MTAPMVVIELWLMSSMYKDKKLNAAVIVISVAAGILFFTFIRQQMLISDRQFLRSMIPHHSGAVLCDVADGVLVGTVVMQRMRLPKIAVLAAATPALAFGHLLGRFGCLLVGDDYGRPSDLPWAVAFPQGLQPATVQRHPTQLYEAIGPGIVGWVLLRSRRHGIDDEVLLGRYVVAAGALRFGIEFIRVDTRVLWGLSVAHLASLAVNVVGIGTLALSGPDARAAYSHRTAS